MSIVVAGSGQETELGAHWMNALATIGRESRLVNIRGAGFGPEIVQRWVFHFWHRPVALGAFSRSLRKQWQTADRLLLATGFAPIASRDLRALGGLGVRRVNYLTDDPWNPGIRAPWFFRSLGEYDDLFTPRRSNLEQLHRLGKARVHYLRWAYAPEIHYPAQPLEAPPPRDGPDIGFVGGGDVDRVRVFNELIEAGFQIALYGAGWELFPETRKLARGMAGPEVTRQLARSAKVSICLTRRANRDGHCMRTFELPAMGACVLAEDTPDHREIYGEEGESVLFFRDIPELVRKTRLLIGNPELRQALRIRCYRRVTSGRNRYADRLENLLQTVQGQQSVAGVR